MRASGSAPLRATPTNSTSSERCAKFGRCEAMAHEPAPMTPSRSLVMSVARQSDAELVERHREDQQRALRHGLPEAGDVEQDEAVVQRADDQQAQDGARDLVGAGG